MKQTITSFYGLSNFERAGLKMEIFLKRSAILYENIIFNPQGTGWMDFYAYVSLLSTSGNQVDAKELVDNKQFKKLILNCWEFVDSEEEFEKSIFDSLSDEVKQKIWSFSYARTMKKNEVIHNDNFKRLVGDLTYDLALLTRFKQDYPETIGNISSLYRDIFNTEYGITNQAPVEILSDSSFIPDFGSLSWDEIFELRNDKLIKDFRYRINEILKDQRSNAMSLDNKIVQDLWSLARQVRPNIAGTIVNGILTNIPTGNIPNPFSITSSAAELYSKHKLKKDYGWIFFIQTANDKLGT